uniref:SPHK1 interactor, AKAP domain containing n=1 Tax=Nothobranchius kadleci TaxID=1051664 RepID=A0A1A8BNT4_NOTKA
MAGAKCRLKTPSNFQSSAMYEGSESFEVEGGSTESTMASSISACKKVLCSNSMLDSSEYWLRNEKTLCRLGLLDEDTEGSCTMICFVSLDPQKTDCHDEKSIKKLASVSPDLPKLVELLTIHQPKENEILLLGGLEASEICPKHPHSPPQSRQHTCVCLLQCSEKRRSSPPASVICDISKFLIGLQWGKERQFQQGRAVGQRVDDDTNRSISSIEEDFLTASEHLGDESEDDGSRNEPESGDAEESIDEAAQKPCVRFVSQKGQQAQHQSREDTDIKREGYPNSSPSASFDTKESAGHYATNLAESVLQDAFIRLSQDETSFVSEAAISVSSCPPRSPLRTKQPSQQRTCSFELPKIVIVQSPDTSDGAADWPETQVSNVDDYNVSAKAREMSEDRDQAQTPHHSGGHKHVEMALACAASVIGTITTPQLTEKIALESASEDDTEELQEAKERSDYCVSSAMCGMAQVAGAVAAVELTEQPAEGGGSETDTTEVCAASHVLMSAAKASAAFTLHCSVAEGTSVEAFRANIAEVLHREAAEVLSQPQGYKSVAHLLETTHNKIVDGITCPKKCCMDENKFSMLPGLKQKHILEEGDLSVSSFTTHFKEQQQQSSYRQCVQKDASDQMQSSSNREPFSEIPVPSTERRARQASLTPQSSLNSCSSLLSLRMDTDSRTPITCYADDLAATVVSMATELAAICMENSTGKQPWFCALNGMSTECPENYLMPACRAVLRRKDGQSSNAASRKHRAPRLSEIKRKTEEQPELMERLVNRVVDESVNLDEPQDPFALFASEVTNRIMNCPELNVVDTSKAGQQRSRLQCEKWSRGKASSYESIPEEDTDPSGTLNTLGPGSRLGQNLSRGSSISKQSSCESITDEFSRFMVNQMETEGRGFDLLLDYYAGKNASSILTAAVQQAATKRHGHLNMRTSSCLSKQSSTESITEEFYRFMLRDMDKENKEYGVAKTKEWSNSLFPPSPRTPFCIRQSSVPDRRSSDSRLTVNSPIKANSFDGFARNVYGDTLNIYPSSSVSATGLCKSDSCLYRRGKTDQITDMLIHETWSSSIESLMRKNKIIADPEDSIESEASGDSQLHVQQFANRLAADIVDIGKSALGAQQDVAVGIPGSHPQPHMPVGERRQGFKQSHLTCSRRRSSQEQPCPGEGSGASDNSISCMRGPRDVPLIHIEGDQKVEEALLIPEKVGGPKAADTTRMERAIANNSSSERDRSTAAVAAVVKRDKRSMSASSEESMGSWSHVTPEDDPHEETSSFIQLSEGNGTSSTSSLGLTDLDAFSEVPTQSTVISEVTEKISSAGAKANVHESPAGPSAGGSSILRQFLVVNCNLEQERMDSELRVALQWIAASELGLPALYFRKSKEKKVVKFQRVVHLMAQKAWRIKDLFSAVVQFCKLHEEEAGQAIQASLFDWLLDIL